jgi:HPr kinase/phosphorylase
MADRFLENFSLIKQRKSITVREVFVDNAKALEVRQACGSEKSLSHRITEPDIHFPGLALTGFLYHFHHTKVQFVSDMEWHYINSLPSHRRISALDRLFRYSPPVIVVTHGRTPQPEFLSCAKKADIPVFTTPLDSTEAWRRITDFLEDAFALKTTVHASLADVYGIGLLYIGRSGIGKSECVLDLVERGHRLVADDMITITKKGGSLVGTGNPLLGHHMEIRGVGLINIQALFGIRAIRLDKKVEVVVELTEWNPRADFERLGLSQTTMDILGVKLDKVTIPIFPGKNITVISEVIAMNILLKYNGIHVARDFNEKLMATLKQKSERKGKELTE